MREEAYSTSSINQPRITVSLSQQEWTEELDEHLDCPGRTQIRFENIL